MARRVRLAAIRRTGRAGCSEALHRCIEARAALAELRQAAELITNQAMLINALPLLEPKDSAEIETIVATTDAFFKHTALYCHCG